MDATEYYNKILLLGTFFTAIHHTRKAKDNLTLKSLKKMGKILKVTISNAFSFVYV